jgi:hypothetical protein
MASSYATWGEISPSVDSGFSAMQSSKSTIAGFGRAGCQSPSFVQLSPILTAKRVSRGYEQ